MRYIERNPVRNSGLSMVRGTVATIAFAVGTLVSAWSAHANNGLTLIGTGAESVGMAGAGIAVARDTGALATNPAGLGQLTKAAFDGYLAGAFAIDVAHADGFDNDQRVANWFIPNLGVGISTPIAGTPFTAGVGLFGQAGAGSVYNDINTPFGGRDTLRAQFGVLKVVPGIAWQAMPRAPT